MLVGTSGYNYAHWRGKFYPPELKGEQMLPFYAKYFDTVEVNSTFYHMPRRETVRRWLDDLPTGFVFAVKGNRRITHFNKLRGVEALLEQFYESVMVIGNRLAVVLWQLPPSLKADLELLQSFLNALKVYEVRVALEFRHASWVSDQVWDLLRHYDAAFVVSHGDNYPLVEQVTASFAYVRLHGYPELYRSSYSETELRSWARRIRDWNKRCNDVFVYFNNDMYGHALENALTLRRLLQENL